MKTGKETLIEFCNTTKTQNIEDTSYVLMCINLEKSLIDNTEEYLDYCPNAFGISINECYENDVPFNEQETQCKECWKKALL